MDGLYICNTSDIPDDGCKGFPLPSNTKHSNNKTDDNNRQDESQDFFIVNRNKKYYAYKNNCPHTGASLNWQPDVFMDYDNFYIQCAIHAARFEVESGFCVWGPCANQSLRKMAINIVDNKIYLLADSLPINR